MTSAAQDSFDKAAMHNRKVLDATRMLAGPDGSSLKCGECGWWGYLQGQPVLAALVACPKCRYAHAWDPVKVCCANPTHAIPFSCGSSLCWNRKSDLLCSSTRI